jgi:hypothetical protein
MGTTIKNRFTKMTGDVKIEKVDNNEKTKYWKRIN